MCPQFVRISYMVAIEHVPPHSIHICIFPNQQVRISAISNTDLFFNSHFEAQQYIRTQYPHYTDDEFLSICRTMSSIHQLLKSDGKGP